MIKKIYYSVLVIVTITIVLTTFVLTLNPGTYIFGIKPIIVGSDDIENIKPYSVVLVDKLDSQERLELESGDVIVYTGYIDENEFLICEQIMDVNDNTIATGDGDKVFKELKLTDIEGKAIASIVGSSFAIKVLVSTIGQILIILLYLSLIIWWIHRIIKRKK